jgi:hypothetical protein
MASRVTTLKDILLAPDTRPKVVTDAADLVESEVRSKSGVSGMAIKTVFTAVKKWKPIIVEEAVGNLLDRFVEKLEPFFADWDAKGRPDTFENHLSGQKNVVANALLEVTDERAREIGPGFVTKSYERLRPVGEKNVEAAVPGLGRKLDKYLSAGP